MRNKTINTGKDRYDVHTDDENNLLTVYSLTRKKYLDSTEIGSLRRTFTGSGIPHTERGKKQIEAQIRKAAETRKREQAKAKAKAEAKAEAKEQAARKEAQAKEQAARKAAQVQTDLNTLLKNTTHYPKLTKAQDDDLRLLGDKYYQFSAARRASKELRRNKAIKNQTEGLQSILRMNSGGPSKPKHQRGMKSK